MLQKTIIMLLLLILFKPTCSMARPPIRDYHQLITEFFSQADEGHFDQAIDSLYATNPFVTSRSPAVVNIRKKLSNLPSIVGKLLGQEKLDESHIGTYLVHIDYAVNFVREPVRFFFEFTRNDHGWSILNFGFEDDLVKLAREKAKSNYIRSQTTR